MVEGGEDLSLTFEARHAVGIQDEFGRQDLQRDVAIQFGIAGSIHFAHPARTNGGLDFVRAKAGPRCDHRFRPLNRTMSFITSSRAIASRLPSRDQTKLLIVRSV